VLRLHRLHHLWRGRTHHPLQSSKERVEASVVELELSLKLGAEGVRTAARIAARGELLQFGPQILGNVFARALEALLEHILRAELRCQAAHLVELRPVAIRQERLCELRRDEALRDDPAGG